MNKFEDLIENMKDTGVLTDICMDSFVLKGKRNITLRFEKLQRGFRVCNETTGNYVEYDWG